ncbi:E3 ubiquitin-protein ligase MARCH8 [Agrilus planipennis]|uniref:E3 ubiquitin-protein ligase MARCH8 n=1 Tax=Agrilus planipennis TaxID=224129 RepID=A0A1W4X4H7_AGRPL|nr:E3 ubiquitin-protein ligase MARCH8 [Agrilus planipennis]
MPDHFIKVKPLDFESSSSYYNSKKEERPGIGSGLNISSSNSDICRICHCEADVGNPLLSPCYCSGSLKYVHQSCLQQWLAASDIRSCELCKFNFILHTKIKPIGEWRRLELSGVERRRLLCAILFHFVAAICVIWSLFVLIDRATEEVQKGLIAWPFWTKLVVVAVGFSGGAVFMYIQCRQYLQLFSRWKAHNRIILVQNAPENEKVALSLVQPDQNLEQINLSSADYHSTQTVANVECPNQYHNVPLSHTTDLDSAALEEDNSPTYMSTSSVFQFSEEVHTQPGSSKETHADSRSTGESSIDALELNIREVLDLDTNMNKGSNRVTKQKNHSKSKTKYIFKSLPNLSASNENLLV